MPLTGVRREIWDRALPCLDVRDNDAHSLYAFALAAALLHVLPGARADVVLPAVLLHDTGWKPVDPADILPAIAGRAGPAGQETIRRHESEGAAIAARILADVGYPARDTERIVTIIDGHDTRRDALDLDDAVVKGADKLWRLTPHGLRTVGACSALDPTGYCGSWRHVPTNGCLPTPPAPSRPHSACWPVPMSACSEAA